MGRARTKDHDLPRSVYMRHGGYYYVADGKWTNLGRDRRIAVARARKLQKGSEIASEQRHAQRFLYVVGLRGQESPIKIGIAANMAKRLAALQTSHHGELEVRACIAVPQAAAGRLEKAAHRWLDVHRLNGEWFAVACTPAFLIALMERVILDRTPSYWTDSHAVSA